MFIRTDYIRLLEEKEGDDDMWMLVDPPSIAKQIRLVLSINIAVTLFTTLDPEVQQHY